MSHDLSGVKERILQDFKPQWVDFESLETDLGLQYGRNLKWVRCALGWSQQDAAAAKDVSVSQYRKYERGIDFARMSTTARYMLASGVPFPYLFVGTRYDYLFPGLNIRPDLLPIQAFCGRCSAQQFTTVAALLSHAVGRSLPMPKGLQRLHPPCPHHLGREVDGYYTLAANSLRMFRQIVGLTQEALADLVQVTHRTLNRYEQAGEEPHFNVVMTLRLWAATGVAPLWMTYGTEFFQARMVQHERMGFLCQLLDGADATVVSQLNALVQEVDRLNVVAGNH